jgi:hypothetical protein
VCLPEFPADYTSFVTLRPENALFMHSSGARLVYRLEGWLEHSLSAPGKGDPPRSVGFRVRNLNVRGSLEGRPCGDAPRAVHATLGGPPPMTTIDLRTGHACLAVPVELAYRDLERDRRSRRKAQPAHLPSIAPLSTTLSVAFDYDLKAGGFVASGAGTLPRLPPFANAPAAVGFLLRCPCTPKSFCLEVCLSIKTATAADGKPIKTADDIRELVRKVNEIWDCTAPGQCCIRFTASEIVAPLSPGVPPTVKEEGAGTELSDDFKRVVNISRSDDCYNVVLINAFDGTTALGLTAHGENAASVVRVAELGTDEVARTLAHELGHALGLAREFGQSNTGVEKHSVRASNLMLDGRGSGTKLNQAQCTRARASPLAKRTNTQCTPAPRE